MRFLCITTLWVALGMSSVCRADIIFLVSPSTQNIVQGQTGIFDIFIHSDAGPVVLTGIDIQVNAGAGNGSAGVFTAGTTNALGSVPFDVTTNPGQAFSSNFTTTQTLSLNSTDFLYGSLTLSTTGVALGTYSLNIPPGSLVVSDNLFAPVATQVLGLTSYTVISPSSVPEPTSLALLSMVGLAAAWRANRKRNTNSLSGTR